MRQAGNALEPLEGARLGPDAEAASLLANRLQAPNDASDPVHSGKDVDRLAGGPSHDPFNLIRIRRDDHISDHVRRQRPAKSKPLCRQFLLGNEMTGGHA